MSKQSHTPGPWEIERYSDGLIQIVGNIRAVSEHEEHVTTVVEAVTRGDEANARLIAAAPEMLGALQHIEEYWNRDSNEQAMTDALWHIIETAQAAIAKATA
ncbi:hypothetical protein ABZR51_25970 [Pseudomonas aeruginosa]|nr:hypothetical protein [Pseudomonas aeruginosa]